MPVYAMLDGYTADELIKVRQYIDVKLEAMKSDKLKALLDEMKLWGISTSELNGHAKDDSKSKLAAKYRNLDDPNQTWVGRGKAPKWYADKVHSGVSKEDMLIR